MAQVFGAYAAANKTQLHDIVPAAPGDRQAHRNRVDFAFAATQWMPPPDGASALDGVLVQAQEPARVTGGQEGGRGGCDRSCTILEHISSVRSDNTTHGDQRSIKEHTCRHTRPRCQCLWNAAAADSQTAAPK